MGGFGLIAKLEAHWKSLVLIVAILSAGFGGGVWAIEVRQEVAANTDDRMIRTYEILELRRAQRPLSQFEWRKHCAAGMYLRVFRDCPPRNMRPIPARRQPPSTGRPTR